MAEICEVGTPIPVTPEQMRLAAITLAEHSLAAGESARHKLAYLLSCVGLAQVQEDEKVAVHNALNSAPAWHSGGSGKFRIARSLLDDCCGRK